MVLCVMSIAVMYTKPAMLLVSSSSGVVAWETASSDWTNSRLGRTSASFSGSATDVAPAAAMAAVSTAKVWTVH